MSAAAAGRLVAYVDGASRGNPGAAALGVVLDDAAGKELKTVSLGTRTIDGVSAEGTRHTRVIPAGQVGNDKPIEIVSERWFSPELQAVVMTKRTDPRMGDTTYKMINIRQGEPERALFEPPSDYTVKNDSEGLRWKMDQMKKQEAEQQQKKQE